MVTNEFDYYLIEGDGKYASPLLKNDDEINSGGTAFLRRYKPIDESIVTHLVFNPPIPKKPDMTDYLYLDCRAVFSKKVYDVLKNINIKDFQLVPSIVQDPKGNEYSEYWIANIYRKFTFLDKDKSKYMSITSQGNWSMIKSMIISQELMSQVPLEERLMYISNESSAYVFYHKSIVDAIMSVNPTGIVFVPVAEWKN
jgi:hypothetical protein